MSQAFFNKLAVIDWTKPFRRCDGCGRWRQCKMILRKKTFPYSVIPTLKDIRKKRGDKWITETIIDRVIVTGNAYNINEYYCKECYERKRKEKEAGK